MNIIGIVFAIFVSTSVQAQFQTEDSASVNLTGGNTDLKTYNFASQNSYQYHQNLLALSGGYNYGESEKVRIVENWNVGLRYDFSLTSDLSVFFGEMAESDRYSGLKRRYNTDIGMKVALSKSEAHHVLTELGYRYSVEKNTVSTVAKKKYSKGRVYLEGHKSFKSDLSGKLWIEYLPNFSESKDYQINFEPSIIVTLTSIFSMKTAYLWKYDNFPVPGKGMHDYHYTLSLIAKFK
ncbi:MAG: DUF481 domain-containing protein [Bacteriovoracaceae bacterium]|jgi:putative salt-induced outer membrane protein|nr:DUF481 domain-containing protein [Bacteriovoracaceae bacterium]